MQPVKYPNLPLDTDTTDLQLAPGRARYRLNCRVGGSRNGSTGSVENVLGTGKVIDRWISTRSFTATCPGGAAGTDVTVEYTVTSFLSQADADTRALALATAAANAALVCTFSSTQSFTASCPVGSTGTAVSRSATATSTVSQAVADALALAAATSAANAALVCTYGNAAISRSSTLRRNNCAAGSAGSPWTINVAAGAFTSTVSQAAADAQAEADYSARNTQANVNLSGSCTVLNLHPTGNAFVCTTSMLTFGVTRTAVPMPPDDVTVTLNWSLTHAIGGAVITSGTVSIAGNTLLDSATQSVGISGVTLGENVILTLSSPLPAVYTLAATTTESVS